MSTGGRLTRQLYTISFIRHYNYYTVIHDRFSKLQFNAKSGNLIQKDNTLGEESREWPWKYCFPVMSTVGGLGRVEPADLWGGEGEIKWLDPSLIQTIISNFL